LVQIALLVVCSCESESEKESYFQSEKESWRIARGQVAASLYSRVLGGF